MMILGRPSILSLAAASVVVVLQVGLLAEPLRAEQQPRELPPVPLLDTAEDQPAAEDGDQQGRVERPTVFDWRVAASLAVGVLALLALRRFAGSRAAPLPPDVFEVLGTGSLGGPHPVRVVRFGPKTLLVSVSSSGCQTLSELADPEATECIVRA